MTMKIRTALTFLMPMLIMVSSGLAWWFSSTDEPGGYPFNIELKRDIVVGSYMNCYGCIIHLNGHGFTTDWLYNYGIITR